MLRTPSDAAVQFTQLIYIIVMGGGDVFTVLMVTYEIAPIWYHALSANRVTWVSLTAHKVMYRKQQLTDCQKGPD